MAEQVDPGTIRNRIVEIRKMRAADIKGNDGNFRTHPAFQRKALAGVMHEIGMAGVLLAYHSERNGGALTLIDGHLRQEDYGQLEWWVAITDLNDREADKLLTFYDGISALAKLDKQRLDEALRKVDTGSEALQELAAKLAEDAGIKPEGEGEDGDLLALVEVTIGDPRHEVAEHDVWKVGPHVLICAEVFTEWPIWSPFLDDPASVALATFPGPFIPLTLRAEKVRLVMVQPDAWVAGHILDQYSNVHGEDAVSLVRRTGKGKAA